MLIYLCNIFSIPIRSGKSRRDVPPRSIVGRWRRCITFSEYDQTKCDADDRSSLFGDQSDNVEVERVTFTYKTHQNPGEV